MRRQRGDTIIEVVLAFTVFSFAVVGSVLAMNKGLATSQHALELTLVRQQIDAQLTMLNNFKQSDPTGWAALTATTRDARSVMPPALASITSCPTATALSAPNVFFMAANNMPPVTKVQPYAVASSTYKPAVTYASVDTFAASQPAPLTQPMAYGLWATIVRSEGFVNANSYTHAYDIHIRACWYGAGDSPSQPTTIATVVRVYDAS